MGEPEILTVSQLNHFIRDLLENEFPQVWVAGEVSGISRAQSGHIYFTLKDDQAQIRSIIWRSTSERLKFELQEGMQLICCGKIDLYPPRGNYQLVVRSAEPVGMGPLQLAFKQLHEKLEKAGFFDPATKQQLPRFPTKIAVVTSPVGAAVRDFLQILSRRWNSVDVTIIPARVQGEGASEEIAAAIQLANQLQPAPDILVVTRGGGSLEDLWCFNEEPVVRALFESRIPTVSAVGHEIDVTLADLAADVRALTPSEAAEKIAPSSRELLRHLGNLKSILDQDLLTTLERAYERLIQIESRPVFRRPLESIRDAQRRLDELEMQSRNGINRVLDDRRRNLNSLARNLESVSPLAVLARGYSITSRVAEENSSSNTEELVVSKNQIKKGDRIQTRVADGVFVSRVESD